MALSTSSEAVCSMSLTRRPARHGDIRRPERYALAPQLAAQPSARVRRGARTSASPGSCRGPPCADSISTGRTVRCPRKRRPAFQYRGGPGTDLASMSRGGSLASRRRPPRQRPGPHPRLVTRPPAGSDAHPEPLGEGCPGRPLLPQSPKLPLLRRREQLGSTGSPVVFPGHLLPRLALYDLAPLAEPGGGYAEPSGGFLQAQGRGHHSAFAHPLEGDGPHDCALRSMRALISGVRPRSSGFPAIEGNCGRSRSEWIFP